MIVSSPPYSMIVSSPPILAFDERVAASRDKHVGTLFVFNDHSNVKRSVPNVVLDVDAGWACFKDRFQLV